MGNLSRFVEPVVLLMLSKKGRSYGYDLSGELQRYALTDAEIERAALYRVLRQLEMNGNVKSQWDVEKGGPARRVYELTPQGRQHLNEWATVLGHVSHSMARFVREVRGLGTSGTARPRTRARRRAAAGQGNTRPPASGRRAVVAKPTGKRS